MIWLDIISGLHVLRNVSMIVFLYSDELWVIFRAKYEWMSRGFEKALGTLSIPQSSGNAHIFF